MMRNIAAPHCITPTRRTKLLLPLCFTASQCSRCAGVGALNIRENESQNIGLAYLSQSQRVITAHIVSMRFSFAFAAKKKRKITICGFHARYGVSGGSDNLCVFGHRRASHAPKLYAAPT